MLIDSPYLVRPGRKFSLKDVPTNDKGEFDDKHGARKPTHARLKELDQFQEILYAQAKHALLIVFQAMDAGGKDGAIEFIFSGVNPQGCRVTSFKKPTDLELSHDFLWRIHDAAPPKGMIGIFNRSHYESVLVERVHDLVAQAVWRGRYKHINDFEKMLSDEGTTILKFFLHISKDEQRERLQARINDPKKNWKFNPADLDERKVWDEYQKAYEDAMEKCSTEHAPWYVVPADRKWYRNWVISDVIVRTIEKLDLKLPPPKEGIEGYVVE